MDFPPVSNLVNATFEQLNVSRTNTPEQPPQAPQPVATGQELDQSGGGLSVDAQAESSSNGVGTVLNASA